MKQLFLIVVLAFSFTLFGQNTEWAPIGAKWWFSLDCFSEPDCGYYTLESVNDTLIDNIMAKVIEIELHGGDTWSNNPFDSNLVIMYSEDNKVLKYDFFNSEFFILYDFNLQDGDTLTIQDTTKFRGFYSADGETDALFQVIVDSNVVNQFGDVFLKHIYTSPTANSDYFFNGPIIERVGNTINILGQPSIMLPGGYPGSLRCYQDDFVNFTSNNCEHVASSKSILTDNISVYPNPVSDLIRIEWKSSLPTTEIVINIYDIKGCNVYSKNITNQESSVLEVDLQYLKKGIYLMYFFDTNSLNTIKLIKE